MKGIQILFAMFLVGFGLYGLMTSPGDPIDLSFAAVDGSKVDLASLRGKVILLDFWATWCGACRDEMPNVVAAYNTYHSQGFEIVGISLDQDRSSLLQFTANNGMVWPQFFDGQGWSNSLADRFHIRSIPHMWLLDKQGRVVTKYAGSDLEGRIAALLQKP
jgi:thiol-disulfide isomerase/thioredoxin